MASDEELRERLLALFERDQQKRQELVDRGELHLGYHPEMERVHVANADALERILEAEGWPTVARVGEDGAEAAWVVAVHAIGLPAFQRRCLAFVETAVEAGDVEPSVRALLEDRIRFNERRPQRYGTILDWDEHGDLSPWTLEDPEGVAERRRVAGLPPLDESVQRARENAAREGGRAPKPFDERQAEIREWARRAGWLDE